MFVGSCGFVLENIMLHNDAVIRSELSLRIAPRFG